MLLLQAEVGQAWLLALKWAQVSSCGSALGSGCREATPGVAVLLAMPEAHT